MYLVKKTKQSPDQSSVKSTPGLLDIFTDLSMYMHPDKFTADQLKIYRRYFIAYPFTSNFKLIL